MQNHMMATPLPGCRPDAVRSKGREELFRVVFVETTDPMLLLDDGRRIVDANPAACLLFGLTREDLASRVLDDLLADDSGHLAGVWGVLLATGAVKCEHGIAAAGQRRRTVDCSYRTVLQADRHLCVVRDTTDRRVLEGRLAQSEKLDSLGRLAGGIAHDFNNLLTAIIGYSELLLEHRSPDAEDRGDLEQIQQAGQRAAVLTQQLLAYSRKPVLAPSDVDLNHTVTALHSMLTRLIREDVSVVCHPSPQPAIVRIDPAQLEQVIVNLVLNARDAIATEGTIRITVARVPSAKVSAPLDLVDPVNIARAREYVQLRVADDGVGIPSEARAHLFEPFFTTKDVGRDTCLGLASVYGIVRQSHGFIEVESELGHGTVFTMYFPAVDAVSAREVQSPRVEPSRDRETRGTILLVEDEDAVRRISSTILRRHGYRVLEASTPGAACEVFAEHADVVDLLLTDVVMPEMNGPGLAQRLVALRPRLRVLFMSGYVDVASPFDVDNPNISFLSKPFQASALLNKVQAVLTRARATR